MKDDHFGCLFLSLYKEDKSRVLFVFQSPQTRTLHMMWRKKKK
ncbi:hypothetical protein bcere0026_34920 [Bacillus mycoides]|uniref:Uncharacterized protein n=1 Tax=Bacillus mycoides TaxID=1405 RepID=C2XXR4_BACMY|nr:hypothetical protein bcere0026_34920 [Bacillus mycoides]